MTAFPGRQPRWTSRTRLPRWCWDGRLQSNFQRNCQSGICFCDSEARRSPGRSDQRRCRWRTLGRTRSPEGSFRQSKLSSNKNLILQYDLIMNQSLGEVYCQPSTKSPLPFAKLRYSKRKIAREFICFHTLIQMINAWKIVSLGSYEPLASWPLGYR